MPHQHHVCGLGRVMQLAYVTKDYDATLKSWNDFGVGPFYQIDRVPYTEVTYGGRPSPIDITSAFAYWGDLQIEVIRQNNGADSIYRDWQAEGRHGLHHVCILVDDMAEARRRCVEQGYPIVQEAGIGDLGKFIFADVRKGPGCLIEFAQVGPPFSGAFDTMRAAARDWDGRRPVRSLLDLLGAG